jgi:phosphatidate cytidylyltransferase
MSPRISPNKTVSGAVSGILASALVSISWGVGFEFEQPIIRLVALGLLIGILAVVGDLFESLIKRSFGLKDLGTFMPGHGGILDRMDAVLFSLPVIFLL